MQGAQAKMGRCFEGVYFIDAQYFWPLFGTTGKPYLSTFRI